jgi:hypothetical protein
MTAQIAHIAPDFVQNALMSRVRFDAWLGDERDASHAHPRDFASWHVAHVAETERTWPPAWRLFLIVGTSAGLWTLILVSLSIAGALRILP